jgi:cytochrome c
MNEIRFVPTVRGPARVLRRALAALPLALGLALAAAGAGTAPGGYTAAQATQGSSVFGQKCSACHILNLAGGAGPALTGPHFRELAAKYKTAGGFYGFISKKMPLDSPGSLSSSNYLAVTAFLLSKNGYAAGTNPLTVKSANSVNLSAH